MEKNGISKFLIGLIMGILLCVIGICTYIVMDKVNNENKENKKVEETEKEELEEINIEDDLVKELYGYINVLRFNLYDTEYKTDIDKDYILTTEIPDEVKLYIVVMNWCLDNNVLFGDSELINSNLINNEYKKIFGVEIAPKLSFNEFDTVLYNSEKDSYTIPRASGRTAGDDFISNKLYKAEKSNDIINLYTRAYYRSGLENGVSTVYSGYDKKSVVSTVTIEQILQDGTNDPIFTFDENLFDTYKFTFKLNETTNEYNLYSIERIKASN